MSRRLSVPPSPAHWRRLLVLLLLVTAGAVLGPLTAPVAAAASGWAGGSPALAAEPPTDGRAIPAPPRPATPVPGDEELIVEQVLTDRFPRVALRFSIRPLTGQPPAYLETPDIAILADGQPQSIFEVHTVGRVPLTGVGTYEVSWLSSTPGEPGQSINGRLVLSINSRPEIETRFTFIRPLVRQAEAPPPEMQAHALIPVPRPNPGSIDRELVTALASMLAGTALLAAVAGLIWHAHFRRAQERLAIWVGRSTTQRQRALDRATQGRKTITISPLVQFLGRIGGKLVPANQSNKLRKQLVLAGRPTNQHYTRFVATKAGLGIGLAAGGFWLMVGLAPFMTTLTVSLCMGLVGFMLPSIWLRRTIKQRQYEMRKALPDALDLMTIGVSAGLAFDGAIAEIVEKWDNELSHEFATMLGELRMGTGRRQALLNLSERTQVEEIQMMVSQLIQAEELGMSLTDTLFTLANQMRLRRRQRAEELAQKAAVKMLIPLVFLIFPAMFVVILGPAAQDMMSFMGGGN